jgi:hypothetical protein
MVAYPHQASSEWSAPETHHSGDSQHPAFPPDARVGPMDCLEFWVLPRSQSHVVSFHREARWRRRKPRRNCILAPGDCQMHRRRGPNARREAMISADYDRLRRPRQRLCWPYRLQEHQRRKHRRPEPAEHRDGRSLQSPQSPTMARPNYAGPVERSSAGTERFERLSLFLED